MTQDQVALVERSFRIVAPLSGMAAAIFYQRLFTLDPKLRDLFRHADFGEQGRKLMAALGFVVGNLRRPDALLPVVADLGRRHAGYGVRPPHYATVGVALLATLEEALGPAFTPDVREAWAEAYILLTRVMQEAAATVEAEAA
jgi:hemoglobin-like flavoprotein